MYLNLIEWGVNLGTSLKGVLNISKFEWCPQPVVAYTYTYSFCILNY